jgi:enoyl-CoA hydratase/carnithine racemase
MLSPKHFLFREADGVGFVTLDRPEKKNSLTFESYAELRDTFRQLSGDKTVRSIVITGSGNNFCSGGDVHSIIAPIVKRAKEGDISGILEFARLTGDLVLAMRACPQPIIAAVDGVCVGAGAILSIASDLRLGTARSKTAFLFARVGLSGADMGACAILPRIIGSGRATELLITGRTMLGDEAERIGFFNRLVDPDHLIEQSTILARELAIGPTFAYGVTKKCLHQEWSMGLEQAVEAEAQAQTICMMTNDFFRAYEGLSTKTVPQFAGN